MKILALLLLAQAAPTPTPSGAELLKTVDETPGLKDRDKPFEIAVSLGRLYAGTGRLAEAKGYYEQALAKAEPLRAFFVAQRRALGPKPTPAAGTIGCEPTADNNLEALLAKARAKAKAGETAAAVSCARAAWEPVALAEVQYGNALFLLREPAAAVATFNKALDTFDGNTEARYARGALLLDTKGDDVAALKTAKADLERFLRDAPTSPRAPQAKRLLERASAAVEKGGISKLPAVVAHTASPSAVPQQIPAEVARAFEAAPRTPEMEASFVKLIEAGEDHLAHGRFEEARKSFLQVMPYQPTNPRLRAGMAWAMIKLNRQPMADNVWRAAIEAPDAVATLGDTLKAKGDIEGARALWSRLRESVPSYAPRLDGRL